MNDDVCNTRIFEEGIVVGIFDIPKELANTLCRELTSSGYAEVDWHYVGGRVVMKALISDADRFAYTLRSLHDTHNQVVIWEAV
jgi:hypothetical protein